MPSTQPSLQDLPPEVLIDHVIPHLDVCDLTRLGATDKYFHSLTDDPTVWRTRLAIDFSYRAEQLALGAPATSAQPDWYKRVYMGLRGARAYVWGCAENGRLTTGTEAEWRHYPRCVSVPLDISTKFRSVDSALPRSSGARGPSPSMLRLGSAGMPLAPPTPDEPEPEPARPAAATAVAGGRPIPLRIIELIAGGWSYAARDDTGGVWVWGQLDGVGYGRLVSDWSDSTAEIADPTRIPLPCRAEALALGRKHMLVLDSDNLVWELKAYGRAYHHTAPELTAPFGTGASAPGRRAHIAHVAAGWNHSVALTSTGEVYLWFPHEDSYTSSLTPNDSLSGPIFQPGQDSNNANRFRTLSYGTVGPSVVHTLPPIPKRKQYLEELRQKTEIQRLGAALPSLRGQDALWAAYDETTSDKDRANGEQVVKVASGNEFLVALKANGEVWAFEAKPETVGTAEWHLLYQFSMPTIKHISAEHESVLAYSSPTPSADKKFMGTTVLMGKIRRVDWRSGLATVAKPITGLEGQAVVQVAVGDWHYTALTAKGEMYTWGTNDEGQLGIGYNNFEKTEVPTKVTFPKSSSAADEPFVFAITASGLHSGALLLGNPNDPPVVTTQQETTKVPTQPQQPQVRVAQVSTVEGSRNPRWRSQGWTPPVNGGGPGQNAAQNPPGANHGATVASHRPVMPDPAPAPNPTTNWRQQGWGYPASLPIFNSRPQQPPAQSSQPARPTPQAPLPLNQYNNLENVPVCPPPFLGGFTDHFRIGRAGAYAQRGGRIHGFGPHRSPPSEPQSPIPGWNGNTGSSGSSGFVEQPGPGAPGASRRADNMEVDSTLTDDAADRYRVGRGGARGVFPSNAPSAGGSSGFDEVPQRGNSDPADRYRVGRAGAGGVFPATSGGPSGFVEVSQGGNNDPADRYRVGRAGAGGVFPSTASGSQGGSGFAEVSQGGSASSEQQRTQAQAQGQGLPDDHYRVGRAGRGFMFPFRGGRIHGFGGPHQAPSNATHPDESSGFEEVSGDGGGGR